MKNIRHFITFGTAVVLALVILAVGNWMSEQITKGFNGDANALLGAGAGVIGIYAVVSVAAIFLLGMLISTVIGIIKPGSKVLAITALAALICFPAVAAVDAYTKITVAFQDGTNTMVQTQLENALGADYQEQVTQKVETAINKMSPSQRSELESKTGVRVEDAEKMIQDGKYTEIAGILQQSGVVDIEAQMQKYGILPDSPIAKMILGGK